METSSVFPYILVGTAVFWGLVLALAAFAFVFRPDLRGASENLKDFLVWQLPVKERSSPRLSMAVPILLHGKDLTGKVVTEETQTLVVNQRGAKVLTSHSFLLGASLEVALPHLKRLAEAKVAWVGPRDGELRAIGIDLGQCGDFWGVGSKTAYAG